MRAVVWGGRIGLAALGLCAWLAAPHAARAGCDAAVRVLLARADDPVTLHLDGRPVELAPAPGGVRVDGGAPVARWSAARFDAARVGGLHVGGRLTAFVDDRALAIVNEVPLEQYVEGAIAGEMPVGWAPEALRAQAVVSRTYALHQRAARRRLAWDVEAGTASQVYVGLAAPEPARRAAGDTRCEVLTHAGEPILAAFHSASGGRTATAGEVWGRDLTYLVSLEVPGEDDSPDTYWRAAISRPTLGRALGAAGHPVGTIDDVRIEERSSSGRVRWIRFRGERGEVRLSGRQLRRALGEGTLRSTLFELRSHDDGFVFVGSGRGHGVGMSQWGARSLAEQGATYGEILARFYPGTTLGRLETGGTAAVRSAAR